MYKLSIIPSAQKDIRFLPHEEIPPIITKINELANNPRPVQSQKLKGSQNQYRLRRGDYRILYTIDDHRASAKRKPTRPRRSGFRRRDLLTENSCKQRRLTQSFCIIRLGIRNKPEQIRSFP